jgi:hypothetical protein
MKKEENSMQKLEHLQLSVNYYSSEDQIITFPNNEDEDVLNGLQNFLDILHRQGWVMINETQSDRGQFRTYHFKKPFKQHPG